MEIIKRGTPPEDVRYTATCGRCRTKIRFSQGEAEFVPDQRDGDFLRVKCPVCGDAICVCVRHRS